MESLVSMLYDIATLLELLEENPLKIRAIQSAARALDNAGLTALGLSEILSVPGVGKGTGELIAEFLETGSITQYHDLLERVPESVLAMTRLRGLGAKKVRILWRELGIHSIAELTTSCEAGKVAALKGFGAKTQANILESIAQYRSAESHFHLHKAMREAQHICEALRKYEVVQAAEICGELRQGEETVSQIVLLISCSDVEGLQKRIADNTDELAAIVTNIQWEGAVMRAVSALGIPVLVECTAQDTFALRSHELSSRASFHQAFVQILSSTGIFNGSTQSSKILTEQDLYQYAGLLYVPPELRIESSYLHSTDAQERLPHLVELQHLRGTLHVHSTWSDGKHSIRQMAERAKALGYEYIALCDHSKTAVYANGLSEERVKRQHEEIDALNAENLGIRIVKGIESDILADGSLDYSDSFLETFEIVVASIHSSFTLSAEAMTKRIIRALEHPATTILGHPTGRLLLKRKSYTFDMEAVLETAERHGKVIEINANPHRLDLSAENAAKAHRMGIMLSINTDAHNCEDLNFMGYGVQVARRAAVPYHAILNALTWNDFSRKMLS